MAEDKDSKALGLFLASVDLATIRDKLGYRSTSSVESGIRRALEVKRKGKTLDSELEIELERIDSLYRAAYPKAIKGELAAIETCSRLSERRIRLLDKPNTSGSVTRNYELTVEALETKPEDAALIESGRIIARQIDYATKHGTGQEVTKALYLIPHLMNVLRELGATPASRSEIVKNTAENQEQKDDIASEMEAYLQRIGG